MECPKCHSYVDDNQTVCPKCHKVLLLECPNCHTLGESAVCSTCGYTILVKCSKCSNRLIPPKCISLRGQIVCNDCATLPVDARRCATCDDLLGERDEVIELPSLERIYHLDCFRCFECGQKDLVEYRELEREYEGDGYHFTMKVRVPFCKNCGAFIYDEKTEDEITEIANAKKPN